MAEPTLGTSNTPGRVRGTVCYSCEVCGGRQEFHDGALYISEHDQRFHSLLERIEALEAALSASHEGDENV
jgi:hypothetical protein